MRLKVKEKFGGHIFQTLFEGMPLVLNKEWQYFTPRQCDYLQAIWASYLESDDTPTFVCEECGKVLGTESGLYLHKVRKHKIESAS